MKNTILFVIALVLCLNTYAQTNALSGKEAKVYTTAMNSDKRLSLTAKTLFKLGQQPSETDICVFVNPQSTYQTVVGIGGALTDASAEVFAKIPKEKQKELISAYYNKEKGIGYTFGRTTIHSCDFSSDSYTYVNEGDTELKSFTLAHDLKFRIPLIKEAIAETGGKLTLFASPWSPPAFMKSNKNMLKGGKLLPEFYDSWAMYFTKFIKAYQTEGITIWGITVQNEPLATQTWESCIYTAEEERDFLKNYLGPIMAQEGLGNKKIIVWDHNRDLMNQRANVIFQDKEASKYAWGLGFHWYETWTGGLPMFENVANVRNDFPEKNLVFTEGCVEKFSAEKYMNWENAERYGNAMIHDFNNGLVAWCDWNILLDEKGGPNHVGNFCFAPIHFDTKTNTIIYTPSYFYIGHFSKFVRPEAKRISSVSSRSVLQTSAFLNSDGTTSIIVLNQSDKEIDYNLFIETNFISVKIPAHAMQTIVF